MALHEIQPTRVLGRIVVGGQSVSAEVHLWRDDDRPEGYLVCDEALPVRSPVRLWLDDGRTALVVIVGQGNRFVGHEPFVEPNPN